MTKEELIFYLRQLPAGTKIITKSCYHAGIEAYKNSKDEVFAAITALKYCPDRYTPYQKNRIKLKKYEKNNK